MNSASRYWLASTFVLLMICSPRALARWADSGDATYAVNFERRNYKVRKDGAAVIIVERQVEILKDSARMELGMIRQIYNASTSKMRVLSGGMSRLSVASGGIKRRP